MTPGLHPGIPADQYHADDLGTPPSLSNSTAQVLLRESPRKAWFGHVRLNPKYRAEYDSKFDIGTCSHAVMLENDASKIVVVQADDWRTKVAKEQRDAARRDGKTPLLERHYDSVRNMVDIALAFIEDSEIADAWHAGQPEVTGITTDGIGKNLVWLRCRFDKLSAAHRIITDFKSTQDASPEVFSRQIVRMGYHIQDSFYRRIARSLGIEAPRFVFLAQSVEPPHECSLHACDPALQEIADAEVERAIGLWRTCITANKWPSYGPQIHWAIPTSYMMTEHEIRMAA